MRSAWIVTLLAWLGCASPTAPPESTEPAPDLEPGPDPEPEPTDPVSLDVPDLPFAPVEVGDNPYLGIPTARRHLLVGVEPTATPADLDDALSGAGVRLSGSIPEAGIVQVELPAHSDWSTLESVVATLEAHPAIAAVTEDLPLGTTIVPPEPEDGAGAEWTWGPAGGGNWGWEASGIPQAWNLARHAARAGRAAVPVTVIDVGFTDHPDLDGVLSIAPDAPGHDHGTHVAGIIGMRWGNGACGDGIASVPLDPSSPDGAAAVSIRGTVPPAPTGVTSHPGLATTVGTTLRLAARQVAAAPRARVVNMSLGYNWQLFDCDPRPTPVAGSTCVSALVRARIETTGRLFATVVETLQRDGEVLFAVAAGNDSGWRTGKIYLGPAFPADLASPMTWAAVHEPAVRDHILVVEAVGLTEGSGVGRAEFSNVSGGGVFAPGVDIASTVADGSLATMSGTSMAAPFATGAAAYLLFLEPSLTNAELQQLLTEHGPMVPPMHSTTPRRLDLLASALAIDTLRPRRSPRIVEWLADMDDGTTDGLRLEEVGDDGGRTPVTDDAHGDGRVDLRDFRRVRDQILRRFDGPDDHAKRDLNEDGEIRVPELERYARAALDATDDAPTVDGGDVALFAEAYEPDPAQPWPDAALTGLLHSADLVVRAETALEALGATAITATIEGSAAADETLALPTDLAPLRDLHADRDEVVWTTPLRSGVEIRWRTVGGRDDTREYRHVVGDLAPGADEVVVLDPCGDTPELWQLQVTRASAPYTCFASSEQVTVAADLRCATAVPGSDRLCAAPEPGSRAVSRALLRCTTTRGTFVETGSTVAHVCVDRAGHAELHVQSSDWDCSDIGIGRVTCRAYPASPCNPDVAPTTSSAPAVCSAAFNFSDCFGRC